MDPQFQASQELDRRCSWRSFYFEEILSDCRQELLELKTDDGKRLIELSANEIHVLSSDRLKNFHQCNLYTIQSPSPDFCTPPYRDLRSTNKASAPKTTQTQTFCVDRRNALHGGRRISSQREHAVSLWQDEAFLFWMYAFERPVNSRKAFENWTLWWADWDSFV